MIMLQKNIRNKENKYEKQKNHVSKSGSHDRCPLCRADTSGKCPGTGKLRHPGEIF